MANQIKPKCGAGQSCGYACIPAHEACAETLDGAISKAAVEALRGHATAASAAVAAESTDFRGKSFAEVQNKFVKNDAKHTIVNSIVDHGDGITTQKVTLVASDGSGDTLTHTLLHMAAVPASKGVEAQPGRIFILADGTAKEFTDKAKNAYWNESRDAAVRAAISLPKDVEPTAKPTAGKSDSLDKLVSSFSPVQPFSEVKTLGQGAYGKAVLTDRGTVVKTSTRTIGADSHLDRNNLFGREAGIQARAAEAGLAPRVLGLSPDKMESELASGETLSDLKASSGSGKKAIALDEARESLVAGAMLQLHAAGIVHKDLHEGNAMIDGDKVSLLDFGLSHGSDDPEYLKKGTLVEEFMQKRLSFAINSDVEAIQKAIVDKIETYKDVKRASMDVMWGTGYENRPAEVKNAAEAKRLKSLKSLDDAYVAELSKRFAPA